MKTLPLRVLSYNIHKGFSAANLRYVLNAIKPSIHKTRADLVFLQEVRGCHDRHDNRLRETPVLPQMEYLAGEEWPHTAYGKNAAYTAGHHGNAVLSRYPILDHENLDVSTGRLQKRGVLHTRIRYSEKKIPLHAICLHLDLFESGRLKQVGQICRRILDTVPSEAPLIVAGDFNDWQGRITAVFRDELDLVEAYQSVHGNHARTFPSWHPFLRLDRIYVRGLKVRDAKVLARPPWNRLSDHAALFAELSL